MMREIYTVGHGGWSVARLCESLKERNIQILMDVRSHPYSKFQPEFCEEALNASVYGLGLRYTPMGSLLGGKPNDPSCYTKSFVDYGKIRQKPWFKHAIHDLALRVNAGERIALLCSEGSPSECHRTLLLGKSLTAQGVVVKHILPDNSIISQDQAMPVVYTKQGILL